MLRALIERIQQTPLTDKDPEADALLNAELRAHPETLYKLAQTVVVQNIALDEAQQRLQQLQQQMQNAQPAQQHSFLGDLLGRPATPPPPPPPAQPVANAGWQPVQQGYAPAPGYVQQPGYAQQPVYNQQPGGFLRGAMQTAAGVAAGAMAFEGIESLLHGGFGRMGFGMPMGGFGGFGQPMQETIVNNYYDEPHGGHGDYSVVDDGSNVMDSGNYGDPGGDMGNSGSDDGGFF